MSKEHLILITLTVIDCFCFFASSWEDEQDVSFPFAGNFSI